MCSELRSNSAKKLARSADELLGIKCHVFSLCLDNFSLKPQVRLCVEKAALLLLFAYLARQFCGTRKLKVFTFTLHYITSVAQETRSQRLM